METEKKQEPKKSPRFIHFGWYGQTMLSGKHKHDGVLTVTYRQTDGALRVGFVFCSPSDNFSRKEGRNEALKIMRNHPIVIPIRPDKFNRDLILELVSYLCGIGPGRKDWDIPQSAVSHYKNNKDGSLTITSRIPGWSKKWWINIAVNGSPMGRHQTPKKDNLTPNSLGFTRNVFNSMPVSEFFRQAKEAGIDIAMI
jgi:hypothetical protein